ncbi:MAG TPA: FAD-dependent oxidoreductase, partial [Terrimicrobiaceae bacterium]|nr:FAD-dependent oxidoreductase [Terrimicrobiaceae bacterium]
MMKFLPNCLAVLCLCAAWSSHAAAEKSYDVVVYGGTGGGVIAAVEAGRLGKSVVLIEPAGQIGGMTSGGLGATDIGVKSSVTGLAREFYHRIWQHYKNPEAWTYETREEYLPKHHDAVSEGMEVQWFFEPKVAEKILGDMLAEAGVRVITGGRLNRDHGVVREGTRIVSIALENGDVFRGRVFIDASYEGDLMAAAGVSYFVGREPNARYGEYLNGIVPNQPMFTDGVSPYKIAGDLASGLLPGVEPNPPGEAGEGDERVQAYTFRVCLTDAPGNLVPITKPEGYDAELYEPHLRWALNNPATLPGDAYFKLTPMPNRKTDSNNKGSFSTDFVGKSAQWAEADYATREKLWKEHETYVKGLLWFLGNDPRVPEAVRKETLRWGLPKDEFQKTGHWPFQLYVREARRMLGDYVVTENDCRRYVVAADGIALASYPMDSHFTSRYVDEQGRLRVEGGLMTKVSPYPVSYRAIVPKAAECTNLLVPVCLSATHAAYGSIRMEPVFMMLGQAAAHAASRAIDGGLAVQDVPAEKIREDLGAVDILKGIVPESRESAPPKLSNAEKSPDLADFRAAVAKLAAAGVISDPAYWLDNARPGNPFDGGKVGEVLIRYAGNHQPAESLEAALAVLAEKKILTDSKGYWITHALPGKKCAIGIV